MVAVHQLDRAHGRAFEGARMLIATINHPVPLFDDSYAVNSATLGPYGDAIWTELVPAIEKRFRGLGAGWARGVFGGSTGGWESLASLVFYPDELNFAVAACPDPITFTSYTTVNIYDDANAYYYDSPFRRTKRPGYRDHYSGTTWPGFVRPYGQVGATVEEMNHRELALGAHSRSCGQWDIWEAVFSPASAGDYPCRLSDKLTGEINASVAAYWRENYDLAYIIERDWAKLGPKLAGKAHVYAGRQRPFYLTNAVMDASGVFACVGSDAEVVIGAHDGMGMQHCFRGYEYDEEGKPLPNSITRLLYTNFLPVMAESRRHPCVARAAPPTRVLVKPFLFSEPNAPVSIRKGGVWCCVSVPCGPPGRRPGA